MSLDLEIGERVTRAELNERFGGGIQGGMLTPAGGKYMFLFSDHHSAEKYGYSTDGWANENFDRYYYTGEGSTGPQSVERRKNKMLLDTLENDREVHLFYAVGTVPGSGAKLHEYLGQFELDAQAPWAPVETLDVDGDPRTAVLFNLKRLSGEGPTQAAEPVMASQTPERVEVVEVASEASNSIEFERRAVDAGEVKKREREFEDSLNAWFESQGQSVSRLRISIPGERGSLLTDSWIEATRTLCEVKADSTRNDIRMAIAQLLDYRRHVHPAPTESVIVVPISPSVDLLELVQKCGLSLAVFGESGLTYLVREQ